MLTTKNNRVMLSDTSYEFGKKLVQIILPAFSSLYFGLAAIWGLPGAEQVVGTTAIITTFLGVCLGISSKKFDDSGAAYDGNVVVTTTGIGSKMFSLELSGDPDELEAKESITFKVVPNDIPLDNGPE